MRVFVVGLALFEWAVSGAAATLDASAKPLHDALLALPFANADRVHAADFFSMREVPSIYLEPESPAFAEWAWADGRIARAMPGRPHGSHFYLFLRNSSAVAPVAPATGAPPVANSSMLAGWSVPPAGMRSAPPLGGVSTGSIELRADGSLHAWTIENASPAGSTKLATLADASMGVRVGHSAKLLRTHPPMGFPGVGAMDFSGAMPFTRLTPVDPALASAADMRVFASSRWRVGDMNASATPAIGFTLTATNPSSSTPLDLSFFFALPLSLQRGVIRSSTDAVNATDETGAEKCYAACAANRTCIAWSYGGTSCEQYSSSPGTAIPSSRNTDATGAASGVRGSWSMGKSNNCATLSRPGTHAAAGSASLCAASEGTVAPTITFGSGTTLATLWQKFAQNGTLDGILGADPVGAAAVKISVPPGGAASLTISLGWWFPYRDFMGTTVGNHYTSIVQNSEAASRLLLPGTEAAKDVRDWGAFSSALLNSSLPTWLGDSLLNSLHHARSAMWLADGRWRQWESFSCVNVDSVHNDGERHIPYLMILGGYGTQSKMRAWAAGATPSTTTSVGGMIQEQLACGCMDAVPPKLDAPCGRTMGDVTSMFIVYLLELWQWTADENLLKELWPAAKAAAEWQIDRATNPSAPGLPHHLIDTYDGLALENYNASAFSGFFHLLAMKAARALALSPPISDDAFAANCSAALQAGREGMDRLLWNTTEKFYRSYTAPEDVCGPKADGSACWHSYYKTKPGAAYTEKGGLCCHGGSGCGPHSQARAPGNATFLEAKAACDAIANCTSFCFTGPESNLKPAQPVQMMWKTSSAGFTANPTPVGANAVMADCTYANVLADSLGLSPLTTDAQIVSHLQKVVGENDTPYGFLVQTGRYGRLTPNGTLDGPGLHAQGDNDNTLWMMANPDWATLSIWRGGDTSKALAIAEKTLAWW